MMGKEYTEISDRLQDWIAQQHVFFVSTAPTSSDGLVNCSPKGLDCLRMTGPMQMAYVDTGGSGIETVAHLADNGRITLMFCAFEGPPKIFRFYGTGRAVLPQDPGFGELLAQFPEMPAARNIIVIDVERIIDSCGFGVPLYEFREHRDALGKYFGKQSEADIWEYRKTRNEKSLDGLPGLPIPEDSG
jgi:hypothetical protein